MYIWIARVFATVFAMSLSIVGLSLRKDPWALEVPLTYSGFSLANAGYRISEPFALMVPITAASLVGIFFTFILIVDHEESDKKRMFAYYSALILLSWTMYSLFMWVGYKCEFSKSKPCENISSNNIDIFYYTFLSIMCCVIITEIFLSITEAYRLYSRRLY